ncbi:MAG: N-acetyltransferase family protein [Alphaproteobacteria bacterium]|nr:MAG: N-acetyltransferase family protein [Alphaproteobacteria bacterium]
MAERRPELELREATPDDAAAIAAVWNPVIEGSLATFNDRPWSEAELAALIAARRAEGLPWLLAFMPEIGLAGFVTAFQLRGGRGYRHTYEHTIILAPEARGHGVGRALMDELEARLRARGGHSLWACVSAANPAGIGFHASIGFHEVARLPEVGRKAGRWLDLVLMMKRLA